MMIISKNDILKLKKQHIAPQHESRVDDITGWVANFIECKATSFEKVHVEAKKESQTRATDRSKLLRTLDAKQRKALTLFEQSLEVTAKEIAELFSFQQRPAASLCQQWVTEGFLIIADPSKKARRYKLRDEFEEQNAIGRSQDRFAMSAKPQTAD